MLNHVHVYQDLCPELSRLTWGNVEADVQNYVNPHAKLRSHTRSIRNCRTDLLKPTCGTAEQSWMLLVPKFATWGPCALRTHGCTTPLVCASRLHHQPEPQFHECTIHHLKFSCFDWNLLLSRDMWTYYSPPKNIFLAREYYYSGDYSLFIAGAGDYSLLESYDGCRASKICAWSYFVCRVEILRLARRAVESCSQLPRLLYRATKPWLLCLRHMHVAADNRAQILRDMRAAVQTTARSCLACAQLSRHMHRAVKFLRHMCVASKTRPGTYWDCHMELLRPTLRDAKIDTYANLKAIDLPIRAGIVYFGPF